MARLFTFMRSSQLVSFFLSCALLPSAMAQTCGSQGVAVQVLGSGGPELQVKRASSSYLVWEGGRPRVLVDAGGGSALRFGESGARMSQLDVILFTHLHVDHSGDLAALIESAMLEDRSSPLPIYGPTGNQFMPATTEFVADLFGDKGGAYRYLSLLLGPRESDTYKIYPHDVPSAAKPIVVFRVGDHVASAVNVVHGGIPALAWRLEMGGKRIVFSGDTNGEGGLTELAANADLFVAHNSLPRGSDQYARMLYMSPWLIGQIAADAHVKLLILSHRMLETLGKEDQIRAEIRKRYSGPVQFANDLDCFPVR